MVMMDALKFRWHRGLRDNLFFYRDSEGAEIDLLLEFGHGVFPIEIKAGATINTDYFRGAETFRKTGQRGAQWRRSGLWRRRTLDPQRHADRTV